MLLLQLCVLFIYVYLSRYTRTLKEFNELSRSTAFKKQQQQISLPLSWKTRVPRRATRGRCPPCSRKVGGFSERHPKDVRASTAPRLLPTPEVFLRGGLRQRPQRRGRTRVIPRDGLRVGCRGDRRGRARRGEHKGSDSHHCPVRLNNPQPRPPLVYY